MSHHITNRDPRRRPEFRDRTRCDSSNYRVEWYDYLWYADGDCLPYADGYYTHRRNTGERCCGCERCCGYGHDGESGYVRYGDGGYGRKYSRTGEELVREEFAQHGLQREPFGPAELPHADLRPRGSLPGVARNRREERGHCG